MEKKRCAWAVGNELMRDYHDLEWGAPSHDDRHLFEHLVLETAQAGLSWLTVLRKRENYRRAMDGFDPEIIAGYDENKVADLLTDQGLIRNRRKLEATIHNARIFLAVREEFGSFDRYIWDFVDGQPIVNSWRSLKELPARTELSDRVSKAMKKRGFKFVGSTSCYAFMQAVGMVNDHEVGCFRYHEVQADR